MGVPADSALVLKIRNGLSRKYWNTHQNKTCSIYSVLKVMVIQCVGTSIFYTLSGSLFNLAVIFIQFFNSYPRWWLTIATQVVYRASSVLFLYFVIMAAAGGAVHYVYAKCVSWVASLGPESDWARVGKIARGGWWGTEVNVVRKAKCWYYSVFGKYQMEGRKEGRQGKWSKVHAALKRGSTQKPRRYYPFWGCIGQIPSC